MGLVAPVMKGDGALRGAIVCDLRTHLRGEHAGRVPFVGRFGWGLSLAEVSWLYERAPPFTVKILIAPLSPKNPNRCEDGVRLNGDFYYCCNGSHAPRISR
jgi:hypothetical protein